MTGEEVFVMKRNKKKKLTIILAAALAVILAVMGGMLYYMRDQLVAKDEWRITQYGPRDINSSFYTLYNPKKGLIVVDGGWVEDADYVREVINIQGGTVDAWILTHPHQDHIGAFNEIYADPQGIEIKEIYTVDMAAPEVCIERASWDSVDTYNDFLNLNISDLNYVYAGDVLDLCGLEIDILNAYDENVEELSKDYLNDGSMMFKVKGDTQSFLFCADVGQSMSDFLLEKWGEELKADYIQMGHHGYGGLKDDFYEMVQPKTAFFDAPDWLMFDTTGTYDNPENAALMEGMGSEVVSFNSAPNSLLLK